ncbi:MAG: penicillin-binding protein 2 [Gammaproteobacteria bacterium]|nr:penicillin-binding protein 2 [Gammaproteobacteria bacterium]
MPRTTSLTDDLRENEQFRRRTIVALIIVILMVSTIIARLFYLQVVNHHHFTTQADDNRVTVVPLAPTRGLIFDRRGRVLAENLPSFTLELIPERVVDLDATINELGRYVDISQRNIQRFYDQLQRKRRHDSIALRSHLSEAEVARFAVNRHRFPGVEINARLLRSYPYGALAVHTLGYVSQINEKELKRIDQSNYSATDYIGKIGIEKFYEPLLHGQIGYQRVETNAQGRIIDVLDSTPPKPGKNLHLTIDIELQRIAEAVLGDQRGAIVAIEPATGNLLSMVSKPSYDPNLFVQGIDHASYNALNTSADHPLFNRILRGTYPPGSTIKPIIALAALEYKKINADSSVFCPGWYSLEGDNHRYRDWKRWGHGHTNVEKAIAESCDVFFYDIAFRLGIDHMHEYMSKFGFGSITNVDISNELSGIMPSRQWKRDARGLPWFPGETLITGIGQGFMTVTPLQLARATAAIANRGALISPRVVRAVSENGEEATTINLLETSSEQIQLKNDKHWKNVVEAMQAVVHGPQGTARKIGQHSPFKIAGKTGTAQVFGIKQDEIYVKEEIAERLQDHALFIGFAPIDDPQIAIAVIVENGGSGSSTAAPIAYQVLHYYLTTLTDYGT